MGLDISVGLGFDQAKLIFVAIGLDISVAMGFDQTKF